MYAIGRQVYIRRLKVVAEVVEANYARAPGGRRRAHYVVAWIDGEGYALDLECGPEHLRPHDYECDGCGGSRAGAPYARDPETGWFCFLCAGPPARDEAHRAELRELLRMAEEDAAAGLG